jgi:transcriptional regulator with XRE-family HTH domain
MLGLKQIRKARKFNQQKVAMDLNISRASLCHYERGVREPSLEILVRMSEYFGVSIYYLITGRERVPGENKDFTLPQSNRK